MINSIFKRKNLIDILDPKTLSIINKSFEILNLNFTDYLTIKDLLKFSGILDSEKIFHISIILMIMFDSLQNGCICIALDSDKIRKKITSIYPDIPAETIINNFLENKLVFDKIIDINKNQYKPIIFKKYKNKQYLYFQKYYYYEKMLKEKLDYFLNDNKEYNLDKINNINNILLDSKLNNKQKISILLAILKNLIIISGGPGTGKTSIIYWIIKVYLTLKITDYDKIKIAAPTGRASQRITESIKSKLHAETSEELRQQMDKIEAGTIHRLLKYSHNKNKFTYNNENLLPAELVIIDEVSMIDIALMTKLLSAINTNTKIVLIGDKNQIPSVEAGAVLNQLIPENHEEVFSKKMNSIFVGVNTSNEDKKIKDRIIILDKSYRSNKNILDIAEKINKQDTGIINKIPEIKKDILFSESNTIENSCYFLDSSTLNEKQYHHLLEKYINHNFFYNKDLKELIIEIKKYDLSTNPDEETHILLNKIFSIIENIKILCIIKRSKYGTNYINNYISDLFKEYTSIYNNTYFSGQPIIINQNDYSKNLFNGECGIILKDSKNYKAVFKKENSYIYFSPDFLPAFSTAFSLTVHKSQGSEYNEILIVLPDNDDSPLLTKEILYTAVTRAKNKVYILGKKNILETAIKNNISRESGINLWE